MTELQLTLEQGAEAAVYLRAMAAAVEIVSAGGNAEVRRANTVSYFDNLQKLNGLVPVSLPNPQITDVTDDLTMEGMVPCPHCGGVLLGRWEEHREGCPAISVEHACGQCERSMYEFAKRRLWQFSGVKIN